jgi:hypothetical protein
MVISFFGASVADIPLGIVAAGTVITLASGTITGMRLHRWIFYNTPWGRRLPADTGAWLGLIVAGLMLLNPLQFLHALNQPVPLVEQRLHAGIECMLRDEPTLPLPGERSSFCP